MSGASTQRTWEREPGSRRFDVSIEGRTVLEDYEPLAAGFAVAQRKSFDVEVSDGFLEIDFFPRVGWPAVSAIEVERLGSSH